MPARSIRAFYMAQLVSAGNAQPPAASRGSRSSHLRRVMGERWNGDRMLLMEEYQGPK